MKKRTGWAWIFGLYCLMMLWLLFHRPGYDPGLPYREQLRYNLMPFQTIRLFLGLLDSASGGLRRHALINLAGNVVMFVPLGVCLPRLWPGLRKFGRFLLTAVLIITAVELLQLLTLVGSCDTDDLILNVLGASVGFALYRMAQSSRTKKEK
jgi:glycopeptide antibiotics resistance protein